MSLFGLQKKVAVVTGAGSGIGESIARLFAGQGATVAVLDIDLQAAEQTVQAIQSKGGQSSAYSCDITQQSKVNEVIEKICGDHQQINILVNNAGVGHVGNIENTSEEDLDRLYAVNVKGAYNCLKAVVPVLRQAGGGAILNLASIASKIGIEDRFAYSMSKGAILTMTNSIACDYIKDNIRCNCVCPARVHTPFVDSYLKKNYPGEEKKMFEKLSAYQPIGRMGRPEEIAHLALYLCSDEAGFVTGSAYDIDGGVTNLTFA